MHPTYRVKARRILSRGCGGFFAPECPDKSGKMRIFLKFGFLMQILQNMTCLSFLN